MAGLHGFKPLSFLNVQSAKNLWISSRNLILIFWIAMDPKFFGGAEEFVISFGARGVDAAPHSGNAPDFRKVQKHSLMSGKKYQETYKRLI